MRTPTRALPRPRDLRLLLLALLALNLAATQLLVPFAAPLTLPRAPAGAGTSGPDPERRAEDSGTAAPAALWIDAGTLLGGDGLEELNDVVVGPDGSLYVAGTTASADFPGATAPPRGMAAFVARLSADGRSILGTAILDGELADQARRLAIAPDGSVVVAGATSSPDFPLVAPRQGVKGLSSDIFVARLSADLSRIAYSTFLGGNNSDDLAGLAVGADGAILLAGVTVSSDFPTTVSLRAPTVEGRCYNGVTLCTDVFATKLSPDGQRLEYSTYLGGSDWDLVEGAALDSLGRLYVFGSTSSPDMLTRSAYDATYNGGGCVAGNPHQPVPCLDLFVTRLTPDGQLDYSTYLGGRSAEFDGGIALDGAGRAYLTARTFSADFPTVRPLQASHASIPNQGTNTDVAVSVLSPDGSQLEYSTFLGGFAVDLGRKIALDADGSIVLTGMTTSEDFPTVDPLQRQLQDRCDPLPIPPSASSCGDLFVARLSPDGQVLRSSTYLGGDKTDQPFGLALGADGAIFVAGTTESSNFAPPAALDSSLGGERDGFLLRLTDEPRAGVYYVAPDGDDRNDCLAPERACATINAVSDRAADGSTINVAAGRYLQDVRLLTDVTLIGAGREATIIDGQRSGVTVGVRATATVTIADLSITGGEVRTPNTNAGGGIYNLGDLTLRNVEVSGNSSSGGGGGIANYGSLTMLSSRVISNTGNVGGGIFTAGSLIISDTVIADNSAVTAGGGIVVAETGSLTATASAITGNSAPTGGGLQIASGGVAELLDTSIDANRTTGYGGGISSHGQVTLAQSRVRENSSQSAGGGLYNNGAMTVTDSLIADNRLDNPIGDGIAGGPREIGGGIYSAANTTLTIERSRISGHRVGGDPAHSTGGGIFVSAGATLRLLDSLVSDNEVLGNGGGIHDEPGAVITVSGSTISGNRAVWPGDASCPIGTCNQGGGIFGRGTWTISNTTISGNHSDRLAGAAMFQAAIVNLDYVTITGNTARGTGGLWRNGVQTSISVRGSIVAGNTAEDAVEPDCSGIFTSLGGNLFGVDEGCGAIETDQAGTATAPLDPRLGPLADNGGPTPNHLPLENSPAIDASGVDCPVTDQRGFARPVGLACDSGAVESDAVLSTGFDPVGDTYQFENRAGTLDPLAFFEDFGIKATTHTITRSEVLTSITGLDALDLPLDLRETGLDAILPISLTEGLTRIGEDGQLERSIPRPTAWLYEEVLVSQLHESADVGPEYAGAVLGGLCAGMSATVGGFKGGGGEFELSPYGVSRVRDLPANSAELMELITKFQGRQVGARVLAHLAGEGAYTPRSLYAHLLEHMRAPDWWTNPELIGIFKGAGCDDFEIGHALLPYKLAPTGPQAARIYVYDPNYPPQPGEPERFIELDFAADTWRYAIGGSAVWEGQRIFATPLALLKEPPVLPYLSGDTVLAVPGGLRGAWGGLRGAWGEVENRTRTGCVLTPEGLRYVEEIGRSYRLRPLSGSLPNTLVFPAGQQLTLSGVGAEDTPAGDMLIFGPGGAMGFIADTTPGATISAEVDAPFRTLVLRNQGQPELLSAFQMHEAPNGEETRFFAVSNVLLGGEGALHFEVDPALGSVTVVNSSGEAKPVTLGLAVVGGLNVTTLSHDDVLPPYTGHTYIPRAWTAPRLGGLDVQSFPAGGGLVAAYAFDEGQGAVVGDSSGAGEAVELRIANPRAVVWSPAGLMLRRPTWIFQATSSARVNAAIREAGELTFEAVVTPASRPPGAALDGRALIAGLGGDSFATNVSLYEETRGATVRYIALVRVRVPGQSSIQRLISPPIARPDGPVHLAVTMERAGQLTLYVDGAPVVQRRVAGSLSIWRDRFPLVLARASDRGGWWLGTFHSLAIYARALTPNEIAERSAASR